MSTQTELLARRCSGRRGSVVRFSRATVLSKIDEKIAYLERDHGFQSGWGTARIKGKPTEVAVAFGEYRVLLDLREEFEV